MTIWMERYCQGDLKAWNIREEWATDRKIERSLQDPHRETAAKGEKDDTAYEIILTQGGNILTRPW